MNEEQIPSTAPELEPEPDPTPPPVLEPLPEGEPAEPVEVITVGELLERLAQEGNAELELPTEEAGVTDVPVAPDPATALIEQVIGKIVEVGIDLGKIEAHTREIEKDTGAILGQVEAVAQTIDHPALTTSFADYTVTEALLLLLLLAAFLSACAHMLRGGLSWLRS